jgi:nicotinate-nucleotide adenylyltransferase
MKLEDLKDKKIIGIFGGSFNPIHCGHVALVEKIKHVLTFKALIIIPCKIQPLKGELELPQELRLQMLQAVFAKSDGISISDYELRSPNPSYSILTVQHYKKFYHDDEIFWILGSDSFLTLPFWYKFEELAKICKFIVVQRKQQDLQLEKAEKKEMDYFRKKYPFVNFIELNLDLPAISSTEIRLKLKNKESCEGLVPKKALKILENFFKTE